MPTLVQFKGETILINLTTFIDTDERYEYRQRAWAGVLQMEGKLR